MIRKAKCNLNELTMNKLNQEKRFKILAALVEGNSMRSISRMVGCSPSTVMNFVRTMGAVCMEMHDTLVMGVNAKVIQCDEVWAYIYCKNSNVTTDSPDKAGDVWTWVAIDSDSKLVVSWVCGSREFLTARYFMYDLYIRLNNRVQLTTDGYMEYPKAIYEVFGDNIDYARLVKSFGNKLPGEDKPMRQRRYSPKPITFIDKKPVIGNPDPDLISTSFVERQNLTMRMHMRRFTRLTNAFSKKFENHVHAQAIHFMYYNFCKVTQKVKTAPAVAAGLIEEPWTLYKLLHKLIEKEEKAWDEIYGE